MSTGLHSAILAVGATPSLLSPHGAWKRLTSFLDFSSVGGNIFSHPPLHICVSLLCLVLSSSSCLLVLKTCSLSSRSHESKFPTYEYGWVTVEWSNFRAHCTLISSSCLLSRILSTFLNFLQIQFYTHIYPAFLGILFSSPRQISV